MIWFTILFKLTRMCYFMPAKCWFWQESSITFITFEYLSLFDVNCIILSICRRISFVGERNVTHVDESAYVSQVSFHLRIHFYIQCIWIIFSCSHLKLDKSIIFLKFLLLRIIIPEWICLWILNVFYLDKICHKLHMHFFDWGQVYLKIAHFIVNYLTISACFVLI